jgi:Transposase DDE domain
MLSMFAVFVQRILITGGLKMNELPAKYYRDLLTAAERLGNEPIVFINSLVELAKILPGRLIVDDTSNPKYGHLKGFARSLFIPSTSGYCQGYKILMFLWEAGGVRFPIGFALWHANSEPLPELALQGFSLLRNQYHLKPTLSLGDGGYGSQEIMKRVTDYGWPTISRFKCNQNLSGEWIGHLIPRGYGETIGFLENQTKMKVVRHKKYFLQCNRLSWDSKIIRSLYAHRWNVEEVFRILKSCLNLSGCQQHSMQRQALYVLLCCVALTCLELYPGQSAYATRKAVISGRLKPENLIKPELFAA